jgi:hypothetical protein
MSGVQTRAPIANATVDMNTESMQTFLNTDLVRDTTPAE